jgi:hypothetical protein
MKSEILKVKLEVKIDFRGVKKRCGRWEEKSSFLLSPKQTVKT